MLPHEIVLGLPKRLDVIKDSLNALHRARRKAERASASAIIIKVLTAHFFAGAAKANAADMADALFGDQPEVKAAFADPGGWLKRATVSPATTTMPSWAAELAVTTALGLIPVLAPQSAYAALSQRGIRLDFEGNAAVSLPRRNDTPDLGAVFIGEGEPLPVKRLGLAATLAKPHKAGVISAFSAELAKRSQPTIESVIRQGMSEDTTLEVDSLLLSNAAATATAPAGLLNGAVAVTPEAGGGLAALAADLGNLVAAIPNNADPVFIASPAEAIRAAVLSGNVTGATIIASPSMPAGSVACIDAADYYSGESDAPVIDQSDKAVLQMADPAAAVMASPTTSLWQANLVGVRWLSELTWGLRRPGRASLVEGVTW